MTDKEARKEFVKFETLPWVQKIMDFFRGLEGILAILFFPVLLVLLVLSIPGIILYAVYMFVLGGVFVVCCAGPSELYDKYNERLIQMQVSQWRIENAYVLWGKLLHYWNICIKLPFLFPVYAVVFLVWWPMFLIQHGWENFQESLDRAFKREKQQTKEQTLEDLIMANYHQYHKRSKLLHKFSALHTLIPKLGYSVRKTKDVKLLDQMILMNREFLFYIPFIMKAKQAELEQIISTIQEIQSELQKATERKQQKELKKERRRQIRKRRELKEELITGRDMKNYLQRKNKAIASKIHRLVTLFPKKYPQISELQSERLDYYEGYKLVQEESQCLQEISKLLEEIIPVLKIATVARRIVPVKRFGCIIEEEHVVHLGLNKKNLKSIPNSIRNLRKLQELNLEDNQIQNLPSFLSEFPELNVIRLEGNPLQKIPPELTEKIDSWALLDTVE